MGEGKVFKHNAVTTLTTLTFQGHMTSSIARQFHSPYAFSYWWSTGIRVLSSTVYWRHSSPNKKVVRTDKCTKVKTVYPPLFTLSTRRIQYSFSMKLFCTSNSKIINECRTYFAFKLPSEIIPICRAIAKFKSKLSNAVTQ